MYIKKFKFFESVDTEDFYKEITSGEFDRHYPFDDDIECNDSPFTEKDMSYIKNLLPKKYSMKLELPDNISIKHIDNDNENHLSISKLKDDWFIIVLFSTKLSFGKYYKCDRLDGLEKCIKEKCI
jgi:hypothetical protein